MSGNGRLRALMEARRREELRKQRVREQCSNLLHSLESKLHQYNSNATYSHFLKENASKLENMWKKAQKTLQSNPDNSLQLIQESVSPLNTIISKALADVKQWSKNRQNAELLIESSIDNLSAMPIKNSNIKEEHQQLINQLKILKDTATNTEQIKKEISVINSKASELLQEDEEAEVRKEIVRNILKALKKQGFVVGQPKIRSNVVHVTGKLPSGKTAIFQIHKDTNIEFDLDGYTGTTCKKELDAVLERMNEEGSVSTTVEQFIWHNPDKIRKGAKDFPSGTDQLQYRKR